MDFKGKIEIYKKYTLCKLEDELVKKMINDNNLKASDLETLKKIKNIGGGDSKSIYEILIRKLRRDILENKILERNSSKLLGSYQNYLKIILNIFDCYSNISENIKEITKKTSEISEVSKYNYEYNLSEWNKQLENDSKINLYSQIYKKQKNTTNEVSTQYENEYMIPQKLSIRITDLNENFQLKIAKKYGYNNIDEFLLSNVTYHYLSIGYIENIFENDNIYVKVSENVDDTFVKVSENVDDTFEEISENNLIYRGNTFEKVSQDVVNTSDVQPKNVDDMFEEFSENVINDIIYRKAYVDSF